MGKVRARELDGDLAGVLSFGFSGIGLVLGAASLIVSWLAYRADRAEHAAGFTPGSIADELVSAVRTQWEAEARVRRLNDPYPLPVSWRPAEADLIEDWELLCRRAVRSGFATGAGRTPAALAGADTEITGVFTRRAPGRRLLVLGEPGAGKSMLLLTLLLGLLDQRPSGGPVPVIFPLASFNPAHQDLQEWMAERLEADYPGLRAPAPAPYSGASLAGMLLRERLVLPLLDGFDELPEGLRPQALHVFNEALPPGNSFVLAGRSDEYRAALHPTTGVPVRLTATAGIQILPLTASVTADYLQRDAGGLGTVSADRWRPVIEQLRSPGSTLARVLNTPLMLFLARTIYNPRPGETSTALPDPAELCDQQHLPSPAHVRAHLLDAYLPAAYRPHPQHPCPWDAESAQRAFTSLATHLTNNLAGTTDIAWWQLHLAMPRLRLFVITSLVVASSAVVSPLLYLWLEAAGIWSESALYWAWSLAMMETFWWVPKIPEALGIYECTNFCESTADRSTTLVVVAVLAALVNLAASLGVHRFPARRISWSPSPGTLFLSVVLGVLVGGFAGWADSRSAGTAWGATTVAVVLVLGTIRSAPADFALRPHPARLLADDRRTAVTVVLFICFTGGFVIAPGIRIGMQYVQGRSLDEVFSSFLLPWVYTGALIGLTVGVALSLHHTAWGPYTVARVDRARAWGLPFDTVAFLRDAHEHRGVRRQVGAVYQFRHLELQRRLAHQAQDRPPQPTTPSAP
ncbi:NACHT domain-containing protein [Streptomyces sp. Lzd4kr]|nr:NACHT domain-containing protein [Streptomyces sp. Lzd4kr]